MINYYCKLSQRLKKTFFSKITVIFAICLYFCNIANASSYVTSYTNPTDSTYTAANYTNISSAILSQYGALVTSSSTDASVDGNSYDDTASWVGGFFTVNPFSPNPLNPNFSKCIANSWSISLPSGSTAFVPTIKVSQRLVILCIGFKGTLTLNGYGQCGFIGLVRVCARNTAPCTNGNDRCCSSTSYDYGRTDCSEGGSSDDLWSCPGCSAQAIYRICAFEDPMFPADLTDTKSGSMPFHLKTSVPPSVTGGDSLVMLGAFIFAAGVLVPGLGAGTMLIGAAIMLAGGIMELIEFITSKMNYTVVGNHGCVDIPLTPFPPPYCAQIPGFTPQTSIISICQNSPDYQNNSLAPGYQNYLLGQTLSANGITYPNNTQVSSLDANCEIARSGNSRLYSTFENPIVRIYFYNLLPLCSSGYTGTTDVCIKTRGTIPTPTTLWYSNYDLISLCSSSVTNNCISFPSSIAPLTAFRPYYNMENASSLGVTSSASTLGMNFAVVNSLTSAAASAQPSLTLAGINNSKYLDATPGNLVKITDFIGVQRVFLVYLENPGNNVCVAERVDGSTGTILLTEGMSDNIDIPVGCIPRPKALNAPSITACSTSSNNCAYAPAGSSTTVTNPTCFGSATCNTVHSINLTTQPRLYVSLGNPAKNAIIAVDTAVRTTTSGSGNYPTYKQPVAFCVKDDLTNSINTSGTPTGVTLTNPGTSSTNPAPCSIYGLQSFSAYVTDKYNQTSDTAAVTNGTITPNYQTNNFSTAGVQYVNSLYCRGATQICLNGYSNPTQTVIAKVIQTRDAAGNLSASKISTDLRDRVIPAYNASASSQTLSSFFNPSTNYSTSIATISRVAIGANDPASGKYYENTYCTADLSISITGIRACTSNPAALCQSDGVTALPLSGNYCTANSALCTSNTSTLCAANGTTALASGTQAVATTCACLNNTTTPATMVSCQISGCEWSFLSTTTNAAIEIGSRDASGNYYSNSICTSSADYTCTAPTSTTIPYPATQIKCSCPDPTKCSCSDTYNTTTKSCTITGCNYAFQPTSSSSVTDAQYYTSGTTTYPISGKDSCPVNSTTGLNTITCYGQREASPVELGLCQNITQPTCPALSYASSTTAGASTNGYANWAATSLGTSNLSVTGTCIAGYKQSTSGAPTRSCNFVDSGYQRIYADDTATTLTNGCPNYTISWGSVTRPCVIDIPGWWPSEFLANQTGFKGAIFNMFNVNYNYYSSFVPLSGYNNNNQKGRTKEAWVTTAYNACHDYDSYTSTGIARTKSDGDQEMLFMTATQWRTLLQNNDLSWLFASSSDTSHDGCYVYDVTNNISATLSGGLTVGVKICKAGDNISFSLVDTHTNTSTSYTNNAYIMQSNLLDFYGSDGSGDYSLTNNSGGQYINHGFVVRRSGFTSTTSLAGNVPSGFVSISTPESIRVMYTFSNEIKTCGDGNCSKHAHYHTNNSTAVINGGCALSVMRNAITYPYTSSTIAQSEMSSGRYIPLQSGDERGDLVNSSLFRNDPGTGQSWEWAHCSWWTNISTYTAGNSAANKSMFLWSSPTSYSACNGDNSIPSCKNGSSTVTNGTCTYYLD